MANVRKEAEERIIALDKELAKNGKKTINAILDPIRNIIEEEKTALVS